MNKFFERGLNLKPCRNSKKICNWPTSSAPDLFIYFSEKLVKINESKSRRSRREKYHIVSSSVQNRGTGLRCSHEPETDQNGWSWKWKLWLG